MSEERNRTRNKKCKVTSDILEDEKVLSILKEYCENLKIYSPQNDQNQLQKPSKDNSIIHSRNKKNKFSLSLVDLQNFLEDYITKYHNFYSKRFKKLDLRKGRVENRQIYEELRNRIISKGQIPNIVYELFDLKTDWIRPGRSKHSPRERMKFYMDRAFSYNLSEDIANIYPEMVKCETKKNVMKRFKMIVRYVLSSKGEAQVMEEFLTIYRNRADNQVGYDLSINNYYNKIVGDMYKIGSGGRFLEGSLNPIYRDVPPIPLANAVLAGFGMGELESKFKSNPKTIRRRFKAYGYGIKGIYDLKDARAFLLMPYIIEGFKYGLNQEEFFKYSENEGIEIFNHFRFLPNKENPRGRFFRSMLKQIWGTSKHKEARYQVIANYILSTINRPDITPGEAETELSQIVDLKYDGEFVKICKDEFKMDFRSKRDEIFKPHFKKLAIKYKNELKINLKIAIELGLCKEDDQVEIRDRASHWVKSYMKRNFGTYSTREVVNRLNPNLVKYKPLKQKVFDYMEDHPIDKPLKVLENFEEQNIETIRGYVKSWKNTHRKKVNKWLDPVFLASKYIDKMNLDKEIAKITLDLLELFKLRGIINFDQMDLKANPKGIVAGAIYLASKKTGKTLTQSELKEALKVDEHTISKRAKELSSLSTNDDLF